MLSAAELFHLAVEPENEGGESCCARIVRYSSDKKIALADCV